mmetsp:Transcript_5802/g.12283  ORF Transcript_5802/g.12283 Transcript_5802/m.12283 type:complete len:654 (-) Transcript_5802:416-2377(-)|eukprot:CAMPEP_0113318352 /NCGR_PEP_ID=MMETSP0010_2-20120614/12951_1 /TAXON_ID=216773 ORGANISM="Corethron hystrix, Strain 308" /NCGR_SAMPLE_ID=MMETSP0010_2 /ASSEMBLY_ACC=CAM_ASM_000155 /LENGTH=653 /DNA_ID=CAMNT_0000175629 /DNA_START=132 /DNA_END=2093 /DNA_ORIENTATION=- /assembly_acc=CAM_ASM_000155
MSDTITKLWALNRNWSVCLLAISTYSVFVDGFASPSRQSLGKLVLLRSERASDQSLPWDNGASAHTHRSRQGSYGMKGSADSMFSKIEMKSLKSISFATFMSFSIILPPPILAETAERFHQSEPTTTSKNVKSYVSISSSVVQSLGKPDATTFEYRPEILGPTRCPTVPEISKGNPRIFGTAGGIYCPRREGKYVRSRPTFGVKKSLSNSEDDNNGPRPTETPLKTNILRKSSLNFILPPAFATEDKIENENENIGIPVLDEAWTLINKYALDRSFNGQDWINVKKNYRDKVHKIYPGLSTSKDIKIDEGVVEKMLNSMVSSLGDKYSRTLDKGAYAAMQKYDLVGIGAVLMPNEEGTIMIGAPPVPGSSADEYAFKKGDLILEVNGISTKDRTAFNIIDQISEKDVNAKEVTMRIRRVGSSPQKPNDPVEQNYLLKRSGEVIKDPVYYKLNGVINGGKKVGYIQIKEFNSLVKSSVEHAIVDLKNQGANAFVLDLRGNPGGAFQSAVNIASYFMNDSLAVSVVDSSSESMPFRTSKQDSIIPSNIPIAIWTDKGTASASEVLVGALHDNCRAVVMGDTTFGKGIIQAVYGLQDGSGLVLTVAKYVTPKGTSIQGVGILPDILSKLPPNLPGLRSDTSSIDFENSLFSNPICY